MHERGSRRHHASRACLPCPIIVGYIRTLCKKMACVAVPGSPRVGQRQLRGAEVDWMRLNGGIADVIVCPMTRMGRYTARLQRYRKLAAGR